MYTQGRSKLSIAVHIGVSRNTVKVYLTTFVSSGCSFKQIDALNDKELDDFFGKSRERAPNNRFFALQRCFPGIDRELKRVGVSRMMLWEVYIKEFPDGFQYTQFCFYYNQWKNKVNPVMHLNHKAGDKLFIDFAGQKLTIVNKDTGEVKDIEVFVTILAASQLTYVEAVMS
jgi:transposase